MSVSGRAGLFTMDDGRFFGDLRGTPYTAAKRQKSGALRIEFGKLTLATAGTTSATIRTTINTGICATATPDRVPIVTAEVSSQNVGTWAIACNGNYTSALLDIRCTATGQFSGQNSGLGVNYIVLGY